MNFTATRNRCQEAMEAITDQIIKDLEAGNLPWDKPWFNRIPMNASTGKSYRGINIIVLSGQRARRGYQSPAWVTFRQAQDLGGKIKKGEKGTEIVFYEIRSKETGEIDGEGNKIKDHFPLLKVYHVFNLDQTEGLDGYKEKFHNPPVVAIEEGERILKSSGAAIYFDGVDQAFYSMGPDHISMPPRDSFKSTAGFYEVAFRELTHWTRHPSRLNRDFKERFGEEGKAFEELVAEIGGAFLCAHIGLPYHGNHSSYIASWLKVLKDDKQAILHAASQAQKAVDLILGVKPSEVREA